MRLAHRLLLAICTATLPRRDREWAIGDLEEEHTRVRSARGAVAATLWLAGETLRLLISAVGRSIPRLKRQSIMRHVMQDVRYALRLLLRSPGFTLVAAITLAVGIGANTAIFSVVHGILLKPLPYPDPDTLVRIFEEYPPTLPEFPLSPGAFVDMRQESRAFQGLAAYERSDLQLAGDPPEHLRGMRVTAGFFELLGYRPLLGREFTREDEAQGRSNVVILSHALWVRHFGSDRSIVGKTIALSGRSCEVVGVLPPGVQHVGGSYRSYPHGESVDVWWPRMLPSTPQRQDRLQHYLSIVGRLRPGVTRAQADDDARRMSAELARRYPQTNTGWSSHVTPLRDDIIGASGRPLIVLLVAAGAVMFIACLNVAGLLLGRATGRTQEIGVRSALGATRVRLIRQLIVESGVLAIVGGVLGVVLAYAVVAMVVNLAPADTPRLHMIAVDRSVLAFTLGATVVTALLFGLAPAIQLARTDVAPALQGGRAAPGGAQQRVRAILVVAEVALAFVLVVTAGLLLRSFDSLLRLNPGFRPDDVLTAVVNLPVARYQDTAAAATFFDRLLTEVRALPGVRAAGITSDLPWTGWDENTNFGIVGRTFPKGEGPEARYHFVTPGFLEATGIPLVAGRDVSASDNATAPPVVLVNETVARQYWGEPQRAVGAKVNMWWEQPATIVGVIGDVKDVPWADSSPGGVYFVQAQMWYSQSMVIVVSTVVEAMTLAEPLERVVRTLDPQLPLASVRTLDDIAGAAFAGRRFTLVLAAAFGLTALFLAVIGVYGVMAQAVAQRVREFGVRQALGARPSDIFRLVLSAGASMALVGLVAGGAIAIGVTRLARSLLFHTSPLDLMTLATVATLLMVATLLACFIPARQATRFDPASALRRD